MRGPSPGDRFGRLFRLAVLGVVLSLVVQFAASGGAAVASTAAPAGRPASAQLAEVFRQARSFWSSVVPQGSALNADLPSDLQRRPGHLSRAALASAAVAA
ncbi:MAG: hypothetical protein WBO89_02790, partial [Propionicimonas sp.]